MKGFVADIEELTEQNRDFRRVLYTGKQIQLVLMSLLPGEEIGDEVHEDRDQFFGERRSKLRAILQWTRHRDNTWAKMTRAKRRSRP